MSIIDSNLNGWLTTLGPETESLFRLLLAALLGATIGLEREIRGRQAGFRTNLLIGLGCCIAMLVSIHMAEVHWVPEGFNINVDPARIAYSVMTGVGFLGAGAIIKHNANVRGLTTAAGIWCVAAIGLACGLGMYTIAAMSTLIVIAALWLLETVEHRLPRRRYQFLTVRCKWEPACVQQVLDWLKQMNLKARDLQWERTPDLAMVDIRLQITYTDQQSLQLFQKSLFDQSQFAIIRLSPE